MRRYSRVITLAAAVALGPGAGAARVAAQPQHATTAEPVHSGATGWYCPMHPNHTSHDPGKCPICGMALLHGDPFDTRDYTLDLATSSPAVRAGVPVTVAFRISHPGTGHPVEGFEVVHDRQYHLFVVGQDLSDFQHLHPERQPDGSWSLELTLPKPGYYRLLSDFVPTGGAPQFLARTIVTAGYEGDLESQAAQLMPDAVFTKTVDSITASVEFDPPRLVAGQYGHFRFTLTDAARAEPVADLQPYLGAFGHMLIVSEDMVDFVHSHPTQGPDQNVSMGAGGPRVSFEGYLPRPGRYRAWTQFLRGGQLTTVPLTFTVWSLEDAVRLEETDRQRPTALQ